MPSMPQLRLVLASGSPRRRAFLSQLNLRFDVDSADVDESVHPDEQPALYVERLANEKAAVVVKRHPGALVLAADTTVVVDREILGKPENDEHARQMLRKLSGREHQVLSGIAVSGPRQRSAVVTTRVWFRPLSPGEIDWYVATGEPTDKAGAYAIQGIGAFLVSRIEGSASNVVGLPLEETLGLLQACGFVLPWTPGASLTSP
jgi:septum formation protein